MLTMLLALAAGLPPKPVVPVQYHVTTKTVTDVDMSAMGSGVKSFVITLSAYVTVTVSDSGQGYLVHVVIDSSTFDGGSAAAMLPPEMLADPKGAFYHIYVVNGKAQGVLMPTPAVVQDAQLAPALALLVPGFRAAKAGDSWADTTSADTTVSGAGVTANTSGRSITVWTVTAADGGVKQIDGVTAGTTSVGSAQMQMDIQLNGTSHTVAPAGELATTATSKAAGQANMSIAGNAVPMKMTVEMTVTRIP